MTQVSSIGGESATDGRRARRDRNRAAVVDAVFELLEEGAPTIVPERVAERAGVSMSSIFRYFDGIDDLQHQAISHHFSRFAPLFELPSNEEGSTDERIDALVSARLRLHSDVAAIARHARARAVSQPAVGEALSAARKRFDAQIQGHFASELAAHPPATRADLVSLIGTLTSFEAWDLQIAAERTERQIRRSWITGLRALLG